MNEVHIPAEFDPARLNALADHIEGQVKEEQFEMDWWYGLLSDHEIDLSSGPRKDDRAREFNDRSVSEFIHACGTSACGAGHAVAYFDPGAKFPDRYIFTGSSVIPSGAGMSMPVPEYAAKLLGLGIAHSFMLFNSTNWPSWARDLAVLDSEQVAFVALLRKMAERGPDIIYQDYTEEGKKQFIREHSDGWE